MDHKTPRTDEFARDCTGLDDALNFARQLEIELRYQLNDTNYNKRLKDLEDANTMLLERCEERTRDYTLHAAKELDKLRAANKDANALYSRLNLWHNAAGNRCNIEDADALAAHEVRIKQ